MSLKISLPTLIFCLVGTMYTGNNLIFNHKTSSKNKEEETSYLIGEYIRYNKGGGRFCYFWKSDDIGNSPSLDSECKGISTNLLNEEIPIKKTLQKLRVKNNYLKDVLKWHHLSKENENSEIENWISKNEWNCKSSKNLEDFSETLIVCESIKE